MTGERYTVAIYHGTKPDYVRGVGPFGSMHAAEDWIAEHGYATTEHSGEWAMAIGANPANEISGLLLSDPEDPPGPTNTGVHKTREG